jgi:hypothetical protein
MREFKSNAFGYSVDLDDPKTYSHLPKTIKELRQLMFSEIGYAFCYMNYWHKDLFDKRDGGQKKRVKQLVQNFTENEEQNRQNVLWYQEQIFLFQEEIENMC